MEGPRILIQSLGQSVKRGHDKDESWQYHGRSNLHSRQACWAILYDLVQSCEVLRGHAQRSIIGFAIDYQMPGKLPRKLPLVICRISEGEKKGGRSLEQVGKDFGVVLTKNQQSLLQDLPIMREHTCRQVADVLVGLEAKACMTDHSGAIPRLFAEMLATGYLAKQAAPDCITATHTLVNAAESFVTPSSGKVKRHGSAGPEAVVRMIKEAIPTAQQSKTLGFDAVGVTVVDCRNDGSPVKLIGGAPSPARSEHHHYDWMIENLCAAYRGKFGRLAD